MQSEFPAEIPSNRDSISGADHSFSELFILLPSSFYNPQTRDPALPILGPASQAFSGGNRGCGHSE